MVTKVGSDVQLAWSGSLGPFMISHDSDPSFQTQPQTLADELPASSAILSIDPSKALECYDVTDATTSVVSSAVEGMGYDPLPEPEVDSLSNEDLWWGDLVTVNGFYFDPIPSTNIMHFNHRPQKAGLATSGGGKYATDATFLIPDDTRSGIVTIQTHGGSTQSGAFLSLVPPGIGPYTTIRNTTYGYSSSPLKGNIWVAADSTVQEVNLFLGPTSTPANPQIVNTISGLTKPYLSRETSDGRILYVDGINGHPEIKQITVSTSATAHYANTSTAAFTRNITPVGIAVSHDGSYAYIADGSTGKLVRIPQSNSSAITDSFGGYAWQFADPCAMDAIDGTYVFASDTRQFVAYTVGSGSTFLAFSTSPYVATSFELDWDVSVGTHIWPTWNTIPTAISYNVNPIGATVNVWKTGGFVEGRDDGLLELDPLLFNSFAAPDFPPADVTINNSAAVNAGLGFAYPSPYQVADRVLPVPVQGHENLNLYLELLDAPDLAGYAPIDLDTPSTWTQTNAKFPYRANDNTGVLDYGLMATPTGTPTSTLIVPANASGNATAYLKIPDRYAGDNFQVAVHSCSYSGVCLTDKITYLSLVQTSWKRVLVERDKMFRRGGVLVENYTGCSALLVASDAELTNGTNLANGDQIVIFDEDPTQTYESGGGVTRTINGVPTDNGDGSVTVPVSCPTPTAKTIHASGPAKSGGTYALRDFSNGHSGGVGVISNCDPASNQINMGTSCFFDVDMRNIKYNYDDAFVQFLAPRKGANAVPFLGASFFAQCQPTGTCANPSTTCSGTDAFAIAQRAFSRIWYSRATNQSNYIQLIGSGRAKQYLGPLPCIVCGTNPLGSFFAITNQLPETTGGADTPTKVSFVMVQTMMDDCPNQSQLNNSVQGTTNHELGHHFYTNPSDPIGHDIRCSWENTIPPNTCPATDPGTCTGAGPSYPNACVMNPQRERWDTQHRFDGDDLVCGDACPNGNQGCCNIGSPGCQQAGDGSIRHLGEPILP
jgi:hypothetical protein